MTTELSAKEQQLMAIRLMRVLRYNKTRNERAVSLMSKNTRHLYSVIPFLLHVNHPELPAYVADKDTPFGLFHYAFKDQLLDDLIPIVKNTDNIKSIIKEAWPKKRSIESLLLMGSIGTIAQSEASDFDYWVCVNKQQFKQKQLVLLQQKLNALKDWVIKHYQLEVHFFICDLEDVRNNHFGNADDQSSGSAQAALLKSEFYSTHIAVAGKAPFWWFMPDSVSTEKYQHIISALKEGQTPDPKFFVDLGNIEKLDINELFGAAIWQIVKAIESPFKSLLKMAKLEVFMNNTTSSQLLCNTLRRQVHQGIQAPGELEGVDPYALMFDELITFYSKQNNPQIIQLLRTCLYLKSDSKLSLLDKNVKPNFKQQIVKSYVEHWDWSDKRVHYLDQIQRWNFKAKLDLSRQIHSFLFACYRRISSQIGQQNQSVNSEDMTLLGRKIDTYYSKKEHKVEFLRSAFDEELFCKLVSICVELDTQLERQWYICSGNQINTEKQQLVKDILKESPSPVDVVIWAVINKIINHQTKILLGYKTAPVTEDDLHKLTRHTAELFPPLKISELKTDDLLKQSNIVCCMAVINFESRRLKAEVESIRLVYKTSWGEIFVIDSVEKIAQIAKSIKSENTERYVLICDGSHEKRLLSDLEKRTGIKGWTLLS